jgi:hypothetical protein
MRPTDAGTEFQAFTRLVPQLALRIHGHAGKPGVIDSGQLGEWTKIDLWRCHGRRRLAARENGGACVLRKYRHCQG